MGKGGGGGGGAYAATSIADHEDEGVVFRK